MKIVILSGVQVDRMACIPACDVDSVIIAIVVMCRVRKPSCTAGERPRVGALYKWYVD